MIIIFRITFIELIDSDFGVIFGSNSGIHYGRPFDSVAQVQKNINKSFI